MLKTYWIATYQSIKNPEALAEYARISRPALKDIVGSLVPLLAA
jgi:hypothetical protein